MQVLYKLFKSFSEMPSIKPLDILAGIGKFLVGIGGIFIGLLFGMIAAFYHTLYQDHRVMGTSLCLLIQLSLLPDSWNVPSLRYCGVSIWTSLWSIEFLLGIDSYFHKSRKLHFLNMERPSIHVLQGFPVTSNSHLIIGLQVLLVVKLMDSL